MNIALEMISYAICVALGAYLYERAYKKGVESQQEKINGLQNYIRQRQQADKENWEKLRKISGLVNARKEVKK